MSEQELRNDLKLAVADEPPMTFDLDELVTTAERLARRRRALIAVGASTAAVAVAAMTIPVFLGTATEPENLPLAAAPPAVSAGKVPATVIQPPGRSKAELAERGAQMRQHLQTELPVVVPDVKRVDARPFGGEADGAFEDGQRYLGGFVSFVRGAQTAIEVHVQQDQADLDRTCPAGCTQLPQPDGSVVVVKPVQLPDESPRQMMITSAVHFRADGTAVRITTYNYDPTGQNGMVFQPDVALTVDQLTRLATDPALRW